MPESCNELVMSHMPLAETIGSRFSRIPVDDAKQEAMVALVLAARKFDPERGKKFSSFAAAVIRNHLLDAVSDYCPLPHGDKAPEEREAVEDYDALRTAMNALMPDVRLALEMRYGESEATFEEIGARLDCTHVYAMAIVAAGLATLKRMMEAER
jgi:RNA polymerase sigma factor (sigma-70 family)